MTLANSLRNLEKQKSLKCHLPNAFCLFISFDNDKYVSLDLSYRRIVQWENYAFCQIDCRVCFSQTSNEKFNGKVH